MIGHSLPSFGSSAFFRAAEELTIYFLPGTPGLSTTYYGRPTALWIPLTLGELSLTPTGPLRLYSTSPAQASLRVQRSANLRDWADWQTVSRDEGPRELYDTEAGTTTYRLYRMIE